MKNVVKIILIVFFSVFISNINVDARTGVGVCQGKDLLDMGYCRLDSPAIIRHQEFSYRPLMLNDGTEAVKYAFRGTLEGKDEDMFCLDSNLNAPGSLPYYFARPLDLTNDYDRAIAKVYSMYINDSAYVMNTNQISFAAASQNYLQIANIVIRALTIKYQYDIVGPAAYRNNIFNNVYAQFEGKVANSPKLVENTDAFKLAQKYYCSAVLTCTNCTKVLDAKAFCSTIDVSQANIREFNIKINSTSEVEQVDTGNPDEFSRIIEMKITGLNSFTKDYETYVSTNPYFKINDVKCANNKLNCSIESGLTKDTDILPGLTGDEYTFKVRVTGNKKDFLTETNDKVIVDYEYHHIFNSNNLAILRYSLTIQERQRMISLMPKRVETENVEVYFPIPALCQTDIVDGKQIYKYGGEEVSELEYLKAGCCNVKSVYLKSRDAHDYYFENCNVDVDIHLETDCVNDGDEENMSHSYVRQQDIDKVMNKIEKINSNNYEEDDIESVLENFKYYVDDNYLYTPSEGANDAISTSNKYCKMYTSEELDIYYPGTAEATSGRFFIFKSQPYITGEIRGVFYTDITSWETDYKEAYQKEIETYNDLQDAINDEEILDTSSYETKYEDAKTSRKTLEDYKTSCEDKSDIANKWNYYLEPDLYFNYQQKFFDPITNKSQEITEQVELETSYKAEKYWPNVSDDEPTLVLNEVEGTKDNDYMSFTYGGKTYRYDYDRTDIYKAGFKRTLYYIPKVKYYSLIPNGKYVTSLSEYQATNYLDVGYVFNVKLTTYQGEYTTWFTINNIGHLMQEVDEAPKNVSNIQAQLNEYLSSNKNVLDITDIDNNIDGSKYVNKCYYRDEEILYSRECPTCEDEVDSNFKVRYNTRTISTNDLFPNENVGDRVVGPNWSSQKGIDARKLIETAENEIYGDTDGTNSYLEYSFILTPSKMQDFKEYNKNNTYNDFNFNCEEGKECLSELLTKQFENSPREWEILNNTRKYGWKYYVDNTWVRGSLKEYFQDGYPDNDSGLIDWP